MTVDRVILTHSWKEFFAGFGLRSFDDFFNHQGGETLARNRKRYIHKLTLGSGADHKVFFLKRFYHPHFKDMLFTWRNFGRFCSQGQYEWQNAKLLLDNHIGACSPVGFGERTEWGLERKSFFISEQMQGQCLTDFVAHNWPQLTQQQKEKIISSLAKVIRKVHDVGIRLPDLYIWHIFIKEKGIPEQWDFAFIDLHRMGRSVKSRNKKIKDLARLYWSMSPKYFDDKLKDSLICEYMGDGWASAKSALVRKIQRRINIIARKRKRHDY